MIRLPRSWNNWYRPNVTVVLFVDDRKKSDKEKQKICPHPELKRVWCHLKGARWSIKIQEGKNKWEKRGEKRLGKAPQKLERGGDVTTERDWKREMKKKECGNGRAILKSKHEAKRVEAGVKDRRREIPHSAQPIQTTRMERGRAMDAFMGVVHGRWLKPFVSQVFSRLTWKCIRFYTAWGGWMNDLIHHIQWSSVQRKPKNGGGWAHDREDREGRTWKDWWGQSLLGPGVCSLPAKKGRITVQGHILYPQRRSVNLKKKKRRADTLQTKNSKVLVVVSASVFKNFESEMYLKDMAHKLE